jgi:hypothetical protein
MNEISIEYKITQQEFMEAYEFHWKAQGNGTMSNSIISVVGIIIGLYIIQNYSIAGYIITLLSLVFLILIISRKYIYQRSYLHSLKYSKDCKASFTNEAISTENAVGKSEINWSIYNRFVETPTQILIYMSKNSFSIIPKSAFKTEQELGIFKTMLSENIKM